MNIIKYIFFLFIIFLYPSIQYAKEVLIYADSMRYDENENLIATGNVKAISEKEIITSDLIIIKDREKKIILPIEFQFKDEDNNYYYGSSGEFSTDFETGNIQDPKILLNDGSRIVGKEAFKNGKLDLINKGAYSPCYSKIKVKDFICPIWQLEGEKIYHDRDKLFLYHKHPKLKFINLPIYYLPYVVTPSPLRKKRKSGFLNPTISFNFLDTKTSQSDSLPYYWAISEDKEMLITPTINYGGGVDNSQRVVMNYDQLISGGKLSMDFASDTNFENQNNESWIRDTSLVTKMNKNLNEKFKLSINSAFQSSPTYLRRSDPNNLLNRKSSLNTSINLDGYYLRKIDDHLNVNISGYQVVRNNEDNKNTPTTFPYIKYSGGTNLFGQTQYINKFSFYNIFRDKATDDHAQQQQKIYHNLSTDYGFIDFKSKINFKTELLTQYYNIENKKIDGNDYNGTYGRIFPMTGIYITTPITNKKNNININPNLSLIVNGSQSSSSKVSNEESTNNDYSLLNINSMNRYTGTDKLDNSKRINYGVDIDRNKLRFSLAQSYEFDAYSNYNQDVGLTDYMSDLLGDTRYDGSKNELSHSFRFNTDQGLIRSQSLTYSNLSRIGKSSLKYTQEREEINTILKSGSETVTIDYVSNNFLNYSKVNGQAIYDLIEDTPTKYKLGYRYYDECFGINLDFTRSFYEDRDLKPSDTLTLLFAFKHLGGYKSTNLAVSEIDKQDIRWESEDIDNNLFK